MDRRNSWRPAVQVFSFRYLIIVPVALAITTATLLFLHSDLNTAMLYSQCHSRARLPGISRIPILGTPSCYLISFFQTAVASARSFAIMAVILSYIAGLLTVYTVEGARICNMSNVLIAYPTGPLLVFNLIGGAVVWQLLIVPAFFYRARNILLARKAAGRSALDANPTDPNLGRDMRHLSADTETVAIPAGVALGFILPSILMLVIDTPATVAVWLFFPIYVTAIRKLVRIIMWIKRTQLKSLHLESDRAALAMVYAAPVICSILSHGLVLWSLTRSDDRKEMTRATLRFIEIDIFFIGLTVLYWLFVEVGWHVVAVMVTVSVVLGPGAGVCVGWYYRENRLHRMLTHSASDVEAHEQGQGAADEERGITSGEETPLLR